MKKLLNFCMIITISISLSSCSFAVKENIEKKEEIKDKNINIEVDSKNREEELNKKIETIVGKNSANDKASENGNTITDESKINDSNGAKSNNANNTINTDKKINSNINQEKEIINKYKSKLYSVKGQYNGKIDAMIGQAKSEYSSLPQENKSAMAKVKIGLKYINKVSSLEGECDNKVYEMLNAMEGELASKGYSIQTVNAIRNYYEDEKSARKSYYMSKLK